MATSEYSGCDLRYETKELLTAPWCRMAVQAPQAEDDNLCHFVPLPGGWQIFTACRKGGWARC